MRKIVDIYQPHCHSPAVIGWISPSLLFGDPMKKLLILSVLSVFALGMMAQAAFAFGDCSGKTRTTTAETSTNKTDRT